MAVLEYLDFELEIGLGKGREYPLTVLRSPAGETRTVMRFPFDDLALERYSDKLRIALLSSAGRHRMAPSEEERIVQEFGETLFEALLSGEVGSAYQISLERASREGLGLRLKLRVAPPELAALPWEFLYDPRQAEYVCLSARTPVVRYLECPQPIRPLAVRPPLRVLGMIASPRGMFRLDVMSEKTRLERALARLKSRGLVELAWLEEGTWRHLQRALRRGPWHVFHFVGHGRYDDEEHEGQLILCDQNGDTYSLGATELARLLADHGPLRLAVLNACEGARGGARDIFSSTAATLVRRGLPAVLAMQYAINDRAAIELAQTFYESLADGLPVDAAVVEARKAVSLALEGSLDWGAPVYFTRSPDSKVFDFKIEELVEQPEVQREGSRFSTFFSKWVSIPGRVFVVIAILLVLVGLIGWGGTRVISSYTSRFGTQTAQALALAATDTIRASRTLIVSTPSPSPTVSPLPVSPTVAPTRPDTPLPAQVMVRGASMALVPAGPFQMGGSGESDERPVHEVTLDAFYIDVYKVTNVFYKECVEADACDPPGCGYYLTPAYAEHPVVCVTWSQAQAYCEWRGARLPTEAEWEKAARGGLEGAVYPWGNEAPVCTPGAENGAQFDACEGDIVPVGTFSPNGYGLFDMVGDIWEWVADWYDVYPGGDPGASDYFGQSYRVTRGGSWLANAWNLRVANRNPNGPATPLDNLGFRCALSP